METQKSFYVTDWLEKRACLTPDRTALVDAATQEQRTFAEWNAAANRTANFLRELGIGRGDRVSVYANNCLEYLDTFFACGKLGAVVHNCNWRLTAHELQGIINDATPAVLIYSGQWAGTVNQMRAALPSVRQFIAIDQLAAAGDLQFAAREAFPATLTERPPLQMDDPWGIYYTGGTTGLPKGAILTHGNLTWNSVNTVMSWQLTPDTVAALHLPLFHIGGPNIFMLPLVHIGGKTVLCRHFDVDQTFDLIRDAGLTHFVGVPAMYLMMQQHPRWAETDFSPLRLVISGGAPCPLPIMEKFWRRGVDFKTGYGLTEAAGNNFWLPPEDVRRKAGSVGFPLFHIEMKIAREDGSACAADEPGELLIRGPHVMPGYWQKPEATAEVLRDGWLHTGDLARRDAEGYFYIIGRSKDMFISGGENVYPAEIESALHAHPAVAEAAVIGVPDARWGEAGKAFVVLAAGCSASADELREFLQARLAKYKIPRHFEFLQQLPKTAIGKLDKKRLQENSGRA